MNFYSFAKSVVDPLGHKIFRLRVSGLENIPETGPFILCANHRSNFDPVIIGLSIKRQPFFMAKAELFRIPLFNLLIRALGAFPVRRGKGDRGAINKALKILDEGKMLMLFPEAKRLKSGGTLREFKRGAAEFAYRSKAPIIPSAIVCSGRVRPFKKIEYRIGRPVTYEELGFTDGSFTNIKEVSAGIRDRVIELMSANYGQE